jgi:hypothetical protein
MIEQISGWVYPGQPCNFDINKLDQYHCLDAACFEFLTFTTEKQKDNTYIKIVSKKEYGVGGYTKDLVNKLNKILPSIYCTVSGKSSTGVSLMLKDDECINKSINKIVKFCTDNKINLDLNIEGLADFTPDECQKHVQFMNKLGDKCDEANILYRVVTVAENGTLWHGNWRNKFLANVNCDYIVMMCYDVMYDHEDSSCTPHDWLKSVIKYTKTWMIDFDTKFICGLPNYGFRANKEKWWPIELLTMDQFNELGFELTDTRAADSSELMGFDNEYHYFITDQKALEHNTTIAMDLGCTRFSLWHLYGGNVYYSNEFIENHSYTVDNVIDPDHTETSEDYENENEFSVTISSSNKQQMEDIIELLKRLCSDSINLKIKY